MPRHSGFVDAGDSILPIFPKQCFKAQHLAKPLSFGSAFKAAS